MIYTWSSAAASGLITKSRAANIIVQGICVGMSRVPRLTIVAAEILMLSITFEEEVGPWFVFITVSSSADGTSLLVEWARTLLSRYRNGSR
jgi:hypothetical protein